MNKLFLHHKESITMIIKNVDTILTIYVLLNRINNKSG